MQESDREHSAEPELGHHTGSFPAPSSADQMFIQHHTSTVFHRQVYLYKGKEAQPGSDFPTTLWDYEQQLGLLALT